MRTNKTTFPEALVVPESQLEALDFVEIFGRIAPLEVDLGCGDGTFLAAIAARNPERNFLGIDRMVGRVRSVTRKIRDAEVSNARVVQFEILQAVQQLLPPESVDVFYLLFPDPWPKRRHHGHRVVTPEFLRAAARAMKPRGELRIATDQRDYFRAMQDVLGRTPVLTDVLLDADPELPSTTFEERFREDGAEIYRLVLRKTSEPRNGIASQ